MMLTAMFMFTTMGICIRLSSAFVPVLEIVFFRNFLALLIMAPVLIRSGSASIRMNRPRLFVGRAAVNFIGMLSGFTAVTLIPLADMTSLTFTGPIFVTIGAALFLGEAIRTRRLVAIGVGFIGALIILRPGFAEISTGAILALVSALSIAAASLIVKKMTETESASSIVFWMVMMQAPIAFVPMLFVWEWPTAEAWIYLWGMALSGTAAHVLFTRACAMVEITACNRLNSPSFPSPSSLPGPFSANGRTSGSGLAARSSSARQPISPAARPSRAVLSARPKVAPAPRSSVQATRQ